MSIVTKLDPRHWKLIRRTFDAIRAKYFSKGAREVQFEIDTDIETLRTTLGKRHFTNAWELSYSYKGEDLNMRQPYYIDDEYQWYQLHVRAFEEDGVVTAHAHVELEPTEYPHGHVSGTNFWIPRGGRELKRILDEEGIEYTDLRE